MRKSNILAILSALAAPAISQLNNTLASFYLVSFVPGAPITMFQSTLILPASSTAPHTPGNIQAVWPGLQPGNTSAVLQNVVANQGGVAGEWFFLPFYCCQPAMTLTANETQVYPGDSVGNIFHIDATNNLWMDIWFDQPGEIGKQAGLQPFSGALNFDPKNYPNEGPYEDAILTIELQGNSTWDFGTVTWLNIIIEAATTETEWCTSPQGGPGLNFTISTPVVTTNGGLTMCQISELVFVNPTDKQTK